MVFSSIIFLGFFLPITLLVYLVAPKKARNVALLAASLFFYAWGEQGYVLILLGSIAVNYAVGLLIEGSSESGSRRLFLAAGVGVNLALLCGFKYVNFLMINLGNLFQLLGLSGLSNPDIHLPIGISFFTFQAVSYIVDVYRGEVRAQKNPLDLALYISLFPQLIAGPIVRYHDIAAQIGLRRVTWEGLAAGIRRFSVGLAKKVLIANSVARAADAIYKLPDSEISTAVAWVGAVCFTLQIYFDFSGYSDMAIGLGRMFGFEIRENFNFPYTSQSIREFWRRWHISLSSWFRDYLYIPLGGNQRSVKRTYLNLFLVFFLCGLWHGAAWTFVVWGMFHGAFLVLERLGLGSWLERMPRVFRHFYTLMVVIVGWVFFRAETFTQGWAHLLAMFGLSGSGPIHDIRAFLDPEVLSMALIGIFGSSPWMESLVSWFGRWNEPASSGRAQTALHAAMACGCLVLILLASMSLASGTHNPFIYYRF